MCAARFTADTEMPEIAFGMAFAITSPIFLALEFPSFFLLKEKR